MKKISKINEYNILYVNIQAILTICTCVLLVIYFFNNKALWLLEIFGGLTLLMMSFNNYIIYRKSKFTVVYLVIGIITIIFGIVNLMGILYA